MSATSPAIAIRFLTDEDVPGGIVSALRNRHPSLDVVRVQEVGLRSAGDDDILEYAAQQDRILITRDRNTMTGHAYQRVICGLAMPGVIVIPEGMSVGEASRELELISLASEAGEWRDRVIFLPL